MKSVKETRFYLAAREVLNYFFIKRVARKTKKTSTWQSFGLRVDWVGRIYTVLNLRKDDVGDDDLVKKTKLLEMMSPINKYLKSLDLHEIMFPAIEQKSDRSYLIVYSPLFNHFTILYFFRILLILSAIGNGIYFIIKFDIIQNIYQWLLNAL